MNLFKSDFTLCQFCNICDNYIANVHFALNLVKFQSKFVIADIKITTKMFLIGIEHNYFHVSGLQIYAITNTYLMIQLAAIAIIKLLATWHRSTTCV